MSICVLENAKFTVKGEPNILGATDWVRLGDHQVREPSALAAVLEVWSVHGFGTFQCKLTWKLLVGLLTMNDCSFGHPRLTPSAH